MFLPCLPSPSKRAPTGLHWVREIKHDGYRLIVRRHGDDWRRRPLEERKRKLAKLLSRVDDGIYLSEHIAEDGATVFDHACRMGLEGIVSKRLDLPYRSGRSLYWRK